MSSSLWWWSDLHRKSTTSIEEEKESNSQRPRSGRRENIPLTTEVLRVEVNGKAFKLTSVEANALHGDFFFIHLFASDFIRSSQSITTVLGSRCVSSIGPNNPEFPRKAAKLVEYLEKSSVEKNSSSRNLRQLHSFRNRSLRRRERFQSKTSKPLSPPNGPDWLNQPMISFPEPSFSDESLSEPAIVGSRSVRTIRKSRMTIHH